MRIEARVEGIQDMIDVLKGLRPAVQRRILRPAITSEGRRMAAFAKLTVPEKTGLLKKSQGSRVKTYQSGAVVAIVGARRGFRKRVGNKFVDPAKYDHLVHGGTKPHPVISRFGGRKVFGLKKRTQTLKMHPGTKKNPYLKRAAKSALIEAGKRMSERMAREITKLAKGNKLKL